VFKDLEQYTTLWSAAALANEEGRLAVKAAHRAFIDAGRCQNHHDQFLRTHE
jgi:hypothetical protein